jgi:hypothetical protein
MALVRKTDVIQVRCRPEDLAAFEDACHLVGIKPTERIRRFMVDEAALIQRRVANNAAWHATKAARVAAVAAIPPQVSTPLQKSSVEAVRQPQSLSERRKAEKALKDARKRRKEDQ